MRCVVESANQQASDLAISSATFPLTLTRVFLPLEHFGTRIARSAAESIEEPPRFPLADKAEVAKLNTELAVEEDVLELEVSVDDPERVHVAHGESELAKDPTGLLLRQSAAFDEVVKELAPGAELGDKPNVGLCRENLKQLADVWVVQPSVVVDLACKRRGERLGDLFHGAPRRGEAVSAEVDEAIRAWYVNLESAPACRTRAGRYQGPARSRAPSPRC